MDQVKNRADLLAAARAAVELDLESVRGEICLLADGTHRGLAAQFAYHVHADGRIAERIACALAQSSGFDGESGWHIDATGLSCPFELEDLEILRAFCAVFCGLWLVPGSDIALSSELSGELASEDGRRVAIGLRVAGGAYPFRLWLDRKTWVATELEQITGHRRTWSLSDYRPGPRPGSWCRIAHRVVFRDGWLEDAFTVRSVQGSVGNANTESPYAPDPTGPSDTFYDDARAEDVAVTRTPRGRLPLVRPTVNGRDVGWFLLDTGAGALGLDEAIADSLAMDTLGRSWIVTSDGGAGACIRRGDAFTLGAMTMRRPIFFDLDLGDLGRALGVKLAGICGFDLFARAVVRVKNQPLAVAVFNPRTYPGPEPSWTPLRFENRTPLVPCSFARGSCVLLMLDTGCSLPVVLHRAALENWPRDRGRGRVASARGLTGTSAVKTTTLPWIEFAGLRFERVRASIAIAAEGALASPGKLGAIGWGVGKKVDMVLDYRQRRAAFTKTEP